MQRSFPPLVSAEPVTAPVPVGYLSMGFYPKRLEFEVLIANRELDESDLVFWDEWGERGSA